MNRLIEYTVFSGFVTAWRFATCPTSRSPVFVIATTDGVVRAPSWFGITTGSPPCITATTEFVVPRSIPIILLITTPPPQTVCHALAHLGLILGRVQLSPLVPSPAWSRVYRLSVTLSSFVISLVRHCISWFYDKEHSDKGSRLRLLPASRGTSILDAPAKATELTHLLFQLCTTCPWNHPARLPLSFWAFRGRILSASWTRKQLAAPGGICESPAYPGCNP